MNNQIYNWKRFWFPRAESISLDSYGYLADPSSEFWGYLNKNLVSFGEISDTPCLILLGEPGIGKSTAIKADYDIVKDKCEKSGEKVLSFDLRSFNSDLLLVRDIFECPDFIAWQSGTYRLHLFLDSLDECLIRISSIAARLNEQLKNQPVDRLNLRIACRTADWPESLTTGIEELWKNENVKVMELACLRKIDVIEAAKANDIDPDKFLDEIAGKEVAPLAIKPITLQFLINIYKEKGNLPQTQAELYEEGCKKLCEETSRSRREARLVGELYKDQRVIVAARIAAMTIFCNRFAIWTDLNLGNVPDSDIAIDKILGGKECVNTNQFEVTESAIKETISSGLFSSRGPNRIGWAHQTYAEFLAAWYLVQHKFEIKEMLKLITHPEDAHGRIIPQLHQTAAWLVCLQPEIMMDIIHKDPKVLLSSDITTIDAKVKGILVDNILNLFDQERTMDDWGERSLYKKLTFPGLSSKLRSYINDKTKGWLVRRVAINIAEECQIKELQDELLEIALDSSQFPGTREEAADAIIIIGDIEAKLKLKALAIGNDPNDPDDELKACALAALWPDHITAEELFKNLTAPKSPNHIGSYGQFLIHGLPKSLKTEYLPIALSWVRKQSAKHKAVNPFENLMDSIMLKAFENLEIPGIKEEFAKSVLDRITKYDTIVGSYNVNEYSQLFIENPIKRHSIVEAISEISKLSETQLLTFYIDHPPLLLKDDLKWLISKLSATDDSEKQILWATLIRSIVNYGLDTVEQIDAVLLACLQNSILKNLLAPYIEPIDILSPKGQKWKSDYYKHQKLLEKRKRPFLKPPPSEIIMGLLNKFESGHLDAWWQLNRDMTLEPDSIHYLNDFEADLTVLPGWKEANSKTKTRIIVAAEKYILEQDPKTNDWLGTNKAYFPAFAGFRALLLALKYDSIFVECLTDDIWRKWAPMILSYPISRGITGKDDSPHDKLIKLAYQHAPEETLNTLMVLIDKYNKDHNLLFITDRIIHCWDAKIQNALKDKMKDSSLSPQSMGTIMGLLLEHNENEAKEFGISFLNVPLINTEPMHEKAIVSACNLVFYTDDASWSFLWPIINHDVEFGKEFITELAEKNDFKRINIWKKFNETELADLFIWLEKQYPYSDDPKIEGARFLGPRDHIADFKRYLLNYLTSRGTYDSVNAISRLTKTLPDLKFLKLHLINAEKTMLRDTWIPINPGDLTNLIKNSENRLVLNGEQLLDVLVDSLKRLQIKLKAETPSSQFLWDKQSDDSWRPKDENSLSDFIKIHLDEDIGKRGIVVGREVRIHRGERTDIHIDAVSPGAIEGDFNLFSAIIEIKGCWNPGLGIAMETQLLNRYLKDNTCNHGLYLVGWFMCDQWDEKDDRRRKTEKITIEEASRKYSDQSEKLSKGRKTLKALVIDTSLR